MEIDLYRRFFGLLVGQGEALAHIYISGYDHKLSWPMLRPYEIMKIWVDIDIITYNKGKYVVALSCQEVNEYGPIINHRKHTRQIDRP